MPNMDYSLIQRTPDGTGKILVTTPGSPDKGSYVLESDMKIYTNQGMVAIADIVDDLVTADAAKPLSANQGVVLKQLIDAVSGGIVPKGDILSSNLPPADDSNKGWQYYCTDINKWATSDGTQWIMTSNNVITQTPDATDTGHALSNAVVTQCCNEVKARLNQHESRLENLEQVAGDYTTVQYRGTNAVPTGKAKYGLVKSIVGKSRAWNQLSNLGQSVTNSTTDTRTIVRLYFRLNTSPYTALYNIDISQSYAFSTIQTASFSGSVQLIHSGSTNNIFFSNNLFTAILGHKYLLCGNVTGVDPTTVDGIVIEDLNVFDLTPIFGPGNEPSTVADALAQLPALGQYNAYDAGSLVDTKVSGVKSVGVNIWDEEWEEGRINTNNGENQSSNENIRSKNYIPVLPNTQYALKVGDILSVWLAIETYDENKSFISNLGGISNQDRTFTTPNNCHYIRFFTSASYGTTYNHDIQISKVNGSVSTVNTTYHPYKTDTLSLPETVTLRGVGTCVETHDVETGVLDDGKFAVVDLSQWDWTREASETAGVSYFISGNHNDMKIQGANDTIWENAILPIYSKSTASLVYFGTAPNKSYGMWDGRGVRIRDDSYSDATTFKNAMSGVYLMYEKATYTPSLPIDPIPDNSIYTEGGGTINTIQDQTPVIDNCLDVGYLAI